MANKKGKQMKRHLLMKRSELIWALSLQDYTISEIAEIFGISTSRADILIKSRPADWSSPWIKVK